VAPKPVEAVEPVEPVEAVEPKPVEEVEPEPVESVEPEPEPVEEVVKSWVEAPPEVLPPPVLPKLELVPVLVRREV